MYIRYANEIDSVDKVQMFCPKGPGLRVFPHLNFYLTKKKITNIIKVYLKLTIIT